jgi:hypothetical protein
MSINKFNYILFLLCTDFNELFSGEINESVSTLDSLYDKNCISPFLREQMAALNIADETYYEMDKKLEEAFESCENNDDFF